MTAIVLWHGWGMQPQVWRALDLQLQQHGFVTRAPALPGYADAATPDWQQPAALIDCMLAGIDEPIALCGWSLGAMLAMMAALDHPEKISHLILCAATPSFVARTNWPHGIPVPVLAEFGRQVAASPFSARRNFITLFNQGDQHARRITRDLIALLQDGSASIAQQKAQSETPTDALSATSSDAASNAPSDTPPEAQTQTPAASLPSLQTLTDGLQLLAQLDLRHTIKNIRQPCLLLHGACDPLMPLSAVEWLARQLPNASLTIVPHAAHAPFVSDPDYCAAAIARFLDGR